MDGDPGDRNLTPAKRDGVVRGTRPGIRGFRAMRAALGSLRGVLHNGDIRSIELAWTFGVAADWALLVVTLVIAYQAGGALLVGLVGIIRMVPATILNVLVDTGAMAKPERALVGSNLVRGAGAAAVAVAVTTGFVPVAFVAIAMAAAAGALVRPTVLALVPAVAVSPDELVSANVAGSLGENLGTFAGPLLAGGIVAQWGAAPAAVLAAVGFAVAALSVVRLHVADASRPAHEERPRGVPLVAGLRELVRRPPAGWVMLAFLAQVTVRGALNTYLAILAIETLGMGNAGVGLLGAAIGVGGIAGAIAALHLGSRRRLAPLFAAGMIAWGMPLVVVGLAPLPGVALIGLGVLGIGNALGDVSGYTLLQRGTSNRARTAVFATLEVAASGGVSAGGVIASVLFATLGIERALIISGLFIPFTLVVGWRWIRRLDQEGVIPEAHADLLRGIPLFAGLPMAALERVASGMREVRFDAGTRLMTQGEPGETYLAIAQGSARVEVDGRLIREVGPGEGVGEIALLRSVPRTATVTADEPLHAFALDRATFLAAVTGHGGSQAAADRVIEERLSAGH